MKKRKPLYPPIKDLIKVTSANVWQLTAKQQVVYVPGHCMKLTDHGVEFGFIGKIYASVIDGTPVVFARYWWPGQEGKQLRTTADAEKTPFWCLYLYDSCPQDIVDQEFRKCYPNEPKYS